MLTVFERNTARGVEGVGAECGFSWCLARLWREKEICTRGFSGESGCRALPKPRKRERMGSSL